MSAIGKQAKKQRWELKLGWGWGVGGGRGGGGGGGGVKGGGGIWGEEKYEIKRSRENNAVD